MNSKSILATLCSIALVCAPLAEAASSETLGMLNSNVPTNVNGTMTPSGATLFAGDRIVSTDGASRAVSMIGGSRLILAGSGTLKIERIGKQPAAKLENGTMAVLSRVAAPILVEVAGTRITSAKGDAVYAVTVNGNSLQVMASKGEVAVEGAGRTIEVGEGKTLDATMSPPDGSDSGKRDPAPAATGGYAGFFTFERVVLIATAAAAAASLGIAIKSLLRTCRVTGSPSTVTCD